MNASRVLVKASRVLVKNRDHGQMLLDIGLNPNPPTFHVKQLYFCEGEHDIGHGSSFLTLIWSCTSIKSNYFPLHLPFSKNFRLRSANQANLTESDSVFAHRIFRKIKALWPFTFSRYRVFFKYLWAWALSIWKQFCLHHLCLILVAEAVSLRLLSVNNEMYTDFRPHDFPKK